MKTLYVSDLDGTLLHGGRINDRSVECIKAAVARGVLFTCATARSWTSTRRFLASVDLPLPVVLHNGAVTVDPASGRPIATRTLAPELVQTIIESCSRERVPPLVNVVADRESIAWVRDDENKHIRAFWSSRAGDPRRAPVDVHDDLPLAHVVGVAALGDACQLHRIASSLATEDVGVAVRRPRKRAEGWWLEIIRRDVSKGAAVLELTRDLGADRIVAFGDDINDVPLFRVASEAYTVGRVPGALRCVATGRLTGRKEQAVAEWLAAHAEATGR